MSAVSVTLSGFGVAAFTVRSAVLSTATVCVVSAGAVCGGFAGAVAIRDEPGCPTVPDDGRVGTAFAAALEAGDCTLAAGCTGPGDCATPGVAALATTFPVAVPLGGVLGTVDVTLVGFEVDAVFAVPELAADEGAAALLLAAGAALGNPTAVFAALPGFCPVTCGG